MEERVALKSLVDMVRQVQDAIVQAEVDREDLERRMVEAAEADGDVAPEAVVKDGTSNVLAAAQAATLDGIYEEGSSGVVVDVGPTEAGLSGEALKTYDAMLTDLANQASLLGRLAYGAGHNMRFRGDFFAERRCPKGTGGKSV